MECVRSKLVQSWVFAVYSLENIIDPREKCEFTNLSATSAPETVTWINTQLTSGVYLNIFKLVWYEA